MIRKNKMKNVLKNLKECSMLSEKETILVNNLLADLVTYWYIYDLDRGTNHNDIFKELFLSDSKLALIDLAEKYFIGNRTLDRYILRYNRLAQKIIEIKYPELKKNI